MVWEWNAILHLHQKCKWSDIFDIEISEESVRDIFSAHLPKNAVVQIPSSEYVQQDSSGAFLSTVNVLSQMLNVWYIYLHLVSCYGKCRYIHHALSVWVCFHYFVLIHQYISPSTCCLVVKSHHFCPSQRQFVWKHLNPAQINHLTRIYSEQKDSPTESTDC